MTGGAAEQFGFPLSYSQRRTWFLEQLDTGAAAYNECKAYRLTGPLDTAVLRQALTEIVRRHAIWRTMYVARGDEPEQVVAEQVELPFDEIDVSSTDGQREEELRRGVSEFAQRRFRLDREPPIRCRLLRVGPDEWVLVRVVHHIAWDGWSNGVFWKELSALYEAFRAGQPSPLAELPLQYADFARWQRESLAGPEGERLRAYWKGHLAGASEQIDLPTDRRHPELASYRGGRVTVQVPAAVVSGVMGLARAERATLYMTLMAAWQALLARYSRQEEFVVGTPFAGRARPEYAGLIGFFANTLPLRADISGAPTFRELLRRVRGAVLGAFAHADLPFEWLVEELKPARTLQRSPLYQVLFAYQSAPRPEFRLGDARITETSWGAETAKLDLSLILRESQGAIAGWIEFAHDVFDESTIERMTRHFERLLSEVARDPDCSVLDVPLVSEDEWRQMAAWGSPAKVAKCASGANDDFREVAAMFARRAEAMPDAVAVRTVDREWSYRELNNEANRLAECLRARGVRSESRVGLCFDSPCDWVLGILAVWKARGAYVPLDADLPGPRWSFIVEDAKLSLLLTRRDLLGSLPSTEGLTPLLIDDRERATATEMETKTEPPTGDSANTPFGTAGDGDRLAYILYTSGSTGRPKGVLIEQRSVANVLAAIRNLLDIGPRTRMLGAASPTFDISVAEMFLPLISGGTALLVDRATARDSRELARFLEREQPSIVQLTPAGWMGLLESGWIAAPGVTTISTGEALPPMLAQRLLALGAMVWDLYGPTESTIWSTAQRVTSATPTGVIGRPIDRTYLLLLDRRGRPAPVGVPGELQIGGAGVARGYVNRADLTNERFVEQTWPDLPANRWYRTGDLCRWRSDGTLEYLGRIDNQVKLRGFRIELGEIEAALATHAAVGRCVVVAREDRPGDKRLVAYYVPAASSSIAELRTHVRSQLPEYMIPSAFVELEQLPLTASGKIDRRQLPPPPEVEVAGVGEESRPRSSVEERLTRIWRDVLGRERVGIHDDFFALGGHSLLAVRLFARIEAEFNQALPLATLFQRGTIAQLAARLTQVSSPAHGQGRLATLLRISESEAGRPLFVLPSLGGELLFSRPLIEHLGRRRAIWGVQPHLKPERVDEFRDFRAMAARFASAIRERQPRSPYALLGYSYGGLLAYETARQLVEQGGAVDVLAVIDTGPGRRGAEESVVDLGMRMARVVKNFPRWAAGELSRQAVSRLAGTAARKGRHWWKRLTSRGETRVELDDLFDVEAIPTQNRELMRVVYAAFRDYVPESYDGALTLFRSTTDPLLAGRSLDLGWRRYVRRLDIRSIGGNHESILQAPHAVEIARQLDGLLGEPSPS